MNILLATCAFLGYLIESIFGFGGTISYLGFSGFFFDFKILILLSIYMGFIFSLTVIIQSWNYIEWHNVKKLFIYCLPGLIVGTYLMDILPSAVLLKIFSVFLILYGLQNLLFPNLQTPTFLKSCFVILGGFIQGLTTTGAPFVIMGFRDEFKNKTSLRATMAVFFCLGNIFRFIQNSLTSGSALEVTVEYWWIAFPLILAAYVGYAIHQKIPEEIFKKLVIILLTIIGFLFLFR